MKATLVLCLVLAAATATGAVFPYRNCSSSKPCPHGKGDCNNNNECADSLICVQNNGSSFGYEPSVDVCVDTDLVTPAPTRKPTPHPTLKPTPAPTPRPTPVPTPTNVWSHCSSSKPCPHGEGDCDNSNECAGSLICIQNNGAAFGYGPTVDVCVSPPTPSACGVKNIEQLGAHAAQVDLCVTQIERAKEKLDAVHDVADTLASVNDAAGDVIDASESLKKVWSVVKPAVKSIPKVGKTLDMVIDITLKNVDKVSETIDKMTKAFPKVAKVVKGAKDAVEASELWSKATEKVHATLRAASEIPATCDIARAASVVAAGFSDIVQAPLDTCTRELKDFNDAIDNFYTDIKGLLDFGDALKDAKAFIQKLTEEVNALKFAVGKEVDQALCCSGLKQAGQLIANVIDVVTCPIDGALAAKAELMNQVLVTALRPVLAALEDHVDFPAFGGLTLVTDEVVLYEKLPAAARGYGLPERLALKVDASIPPLDLNAEIRDKLGKLDDGGKLFDLEHVARNAAEAFVAECKDAIANIGNVGCYCPLKSYGRGVGEPMHTTCPRGLTNKYVAVIGHRCGKKMRKKVVPSHWPSTTDKCLSGYKKQYSALDVADRCWKETCATKTRTCKIWESCCKYKWWQARCTGKTKYRACKTTGPYNDKWVARYTNKWEVVSVPPTCRPGWEQDGLLCYPKCKAGYGGVGPVCWSTAGSNLKDFRDIPKAGRRLELGQQETATATGRKLRGARV